MTARGRFPAYSFAALGRTSARCATSRRACGAACSAAREAALSLIPGLVGAPPPLVRRLLGIVLPCALPLPVGPGVRAPSFLIAALPLASVLVGLHRRLCLGSPPPFVPLLVGAFPPIALPLLDAPLLSVLSFDVALVPPALPRLRLRYRLSLGSGLLLHLLCTGSLVLHWLVLRAPSFFVAALPPASMLVRLRRRLCLGSWALLRPLCDYSRALRRLLLRLLRRPFAPCGGFLGGFAALCSVVRGAPFLLVPRLAGAPLPVGASPPIVTPLQVAPLPRAPSLLVAMMPLATPLVRLCCGFCLGPWAALRPSGYCSWALHCLSLCRFCLLPCSVHGLVSLLCYLMHRLSWYSPFS